MTPADVPVDSIAELLARLVRIPSRALDDPKTPVLAEVERWFLARGLACRRIVAAPVDPPLAPDAAALASHAQRPEHEPEPLALYAEVQGTRAAPHGLRAPYWLLDATLDTAGFGDPATWSRDPLGAECVDGWLVGRGAADSKAGVALFAHLLEAFSHERAHFCGRLGVLFDLDEHSGRFGGARAFFDSAERPRPDGVLIGYPGCDRIMVGARGFERARLVVHGVAAPSGASGQRGLNAALRGAALAQALQAAPLPEAASPSFDRPAQLTVTGLQSGDGGFSQVPDRCELWLDLRLTPSFGAETARALVQRCVAAHDAQVACEASPAGAALSAACAAAPTAPATDIHWLPGWPAYRVPDDHAMVAALREAARQEAGRELPCAVAGPSNIGNYLASLGVPALCGFGVRGQALHAADERMELASIAPVYRIYRRALQQLLAG